MHATFETKQQALQQSFQSTLATEAARLAQAVSDLEEEGMRRRKAERAKKFLEVEVQRLKTQVQVRPPTYDLSQGFKNNTSNLCDDRPQQPPAEEALTAAISPPAEILTQ